MEPAAPSVLVFLEAGTGTVGCPPRLLQGWPRFAPAAGAAVEGGGRGLVAVRSPMVAAAAGPLVGGGDWGVDLGWNAPPPPSLLSAAACLPSLPCGGASRVQVG